MAEDIPEDIVQACLTALYGAESAGPRERTLAVIRTYQDYVGPRKRSRAAAPQPVKAQIVVRPPYTQLDGAWVQGAEWLLETLPGCINQIVPLECVSGKRTYWLAIDEDKFCCVFFDSVIERNPERALAEWSKAHPAQPVKAERDERDTLIKDALEYLEIIESGLRCRGAAKAHEAVRDLRLRLERVRLSSRSSFELATDTEGKPNADTDDLRNT
jgi:hypothetical protein